MDASRQPPTLLLPAAAVHPRPAATPFTSLHQRDAEWRHRLALVGRARRFLYTSTYFYQADRFGLAYADALLGAARRGVAVWLVVDAFGQRLARSLMGRGERRRLADLFAELRGAGVRLSFYRPRRRLQRLLGGGLHVKVQVGDDGEAILSSGNISATSFARWNEYAMALRGPIAAQLLGVVMGFVERPEPAHLALLEDRVGAPSGGTNRATYCVAYHPGDDPSPLSPLVQARPNPVTRELARLVASARRRLRITTFYFKPAPELFRALEGAARRGVAVEIHHSHRDALPPSEAPWLATTYYYRRCLDLGIRLYENRTGEHSKIVVVDDRQAAFGTYNLEHAAHDRLAEAMVVTREPAMVEELGRVVERIARAPENRPVDRTALASLPLGLKAKRLALYPIRRWV
jgi:cardiolipin synthase